MKGKNLIATLGLSALILTGCAKSTNESPKNLEKGPDMINYFARLPIDDTIAMVSGDYNEDGHLDVIVGFDDELRLYEGDGKGNFKLRQYEKK